MHRSKQYQHFFKWLLIFVFLAYATGCWAEMTNDIILSEKGEIKDEEIYQQFGNLVTFGKISAPLSVMDTLDGEISVRIGLK